MSSINPDKFEKSNSPELLPNKPMSSAFLSFITPKLNALTMH